MDKSPKKRKGFFTLKKGLARFAAENETEARARGERPGRASERSRTQGRKDRGMKGPSQTLVRRSAVGGAQGGRALVRPRTGRGSSLSFTPVRGERVHSRVTACASVAEGEVKWVGNRRKVDLNKSYYPKKEDTDKQKKVWYVIDAEGKTLGRLAVSTKFSRSLGRVPLFPDAVRSPLAVRRLSFRCTFEASTSQRTLPAWIRAGTLS